MSSKQGRESCETFLKLYGENVVSAVGLEIDRIEDEIRRKFPGVHYVDIEVDRGRSGRLSLESFRKGLEAVDVPQEVKA